MRLKTRSLQVETGGTDARVGAYVAGLEQQLQILGANANLR